MNKPDPLLAQVGRTLGLPLVFDASGQCLIMLDNKLMISIRYGESGWTFYCMLTTVPLTTVPPQTAAQFWQACLQLNLTLAERGLGAISYEAKAEALLYLAFLPTPTSSVQVCEFLAELVDRYDAVFTAIETELAAHNLAEAVNPILRGK